MMPNFAINTMLDAMIPISRFNKGEANKIFDEVEQSGYKIVVKNNVPACILITPERYKEMIETFEDQYLLALAEERLKNDNGVRYSEEDIMRMYGITEEDLGNAEDVEIE